MSETQKIELKSFLAAKPFEEIFDNPPYNTSRILENCKGLARIIKIPVCFYFSFGNISVDILVTFI